MKRKVILGILVALLMVLTSSFPVATAPAASITVGSFVYDATAGPFDSFGAYNVSWENARPYKVELRLLHVSGSFGVSAEDYAPKGKNAKYPQNVDITGTFTSSGFSPGTEFEVWVHLLNRKLDYIASFYVTNITWGTDLTWSPT